MLGELHAEAFSRRAVHPRDKAVDHPTGDELELSVSARFVEFASEAPVDDVELVELEDPLDGVDEVPGPPEAERPVDAEAGLDEPPPAGAQAA
jgi:hypothetical protein